jgi:hypothetical protein
MARSYVLTPLGLAGPLGSAYDARYSAPPGWSVVRRDGDAEDDDPEDGN